MASTWLLPSVIILFASLSIYLFLKTKTPTKNHPPEPPGLPVIGNLHQLGVLPHQSLWKLSKKYGPVMLIKLGLTPTVIISSPDAAKQLFKNHDLDTCSRPPLAGPRKLSYNNKDVAFVPYGDYWRNMRKLCMLELFSAKRVQSFRFVREEEVSSLINSLSSSDHHPVDLGKKIMALTANITCRVAFGKSFQERGFDHERFQELIHESFAVLGSFYATDFFPYVGWIVDRITGLHSRLENIFQKFDSFYQIIVDEHIQKGIIAKDEQQDIIDVLLEFGTSQNVDEEESGAFQLSQDHIKAILMNIFLAGVDTAALTLVWAMAELIRNPRAMKKAQEEIRTYVGDKGKVTENDIEKLEYLKKISKETLRLHPPAPLLVPREAMSQFNINGYEIYPKTQIQVNAWAIGRDPKTWKNPEEFIPERFTDSDIDYKGINYEMLPFGSGRRGCPAGSMGMATMELALANLLYSFDWKLPYNNMNMKPQDINMEEAPGLTIYKKEPLLLVPCPLNIKN